MRVNQKVTVKALPVKRPVKVTFITGQIKKYKSIDQAILDLKMHLQNRYSIAHGGNFFSVSISRNLNRSQALSFLIELEQKYFDETRIIEDEIFQLEAWKLNKLLGYED